MDPLARLSTALYAALTGMVYAGVSVPAFKHTAAKPPPNYVLVDSPKIIEEWGRPSLRFWTCEVVLDVITRFATKNVSEVPAEAIASLVLDRLDLKALPMPADWQCMEGRTSEVDDEGDDSNGQQQVVHRRLRVQWLLSYTAPSTSAPVAALPPGLLPVMLPFALT